MLKDIVLKEIRDFLEETGMSPSTFGLKAMNDNHFYERLSQPGYDIKASTIDKVRNFINESRT